MSEAPRIWDRWPEVDRLFASALDQPAGGRAAFVERESGGDGELIAAVRMLLRADEQAEGLFEAPGSTATREALTDLGARAGEPGTIGRYPVVRELGRGGMGTVHLAELEGDGFRQPVAVKLLRRGVDTEDVMRRFLIERRILASLNHPNIARLVDGGATDDGRPFLVMEYVEGEPITTYCDRQRCTLRQRLDLFLDACDAVTAAHARLVVHRDLKPSNILVTAAGQLKLLDFGIAKLLDPDEGAEHTQTGVHLLTPEHASPEQLRGEPVTTATDVYQLGVLLFTLLTGHRPHSAPGRSLAAWRELAGRLDAPRPSAVIARDGNAAAVAEARGTTAAQLRRALKGDLDTIVQKALQPSPDARYASAERLARDVRRFVDGRTISARPETMVYRTRTFLKRQPWVAPVALMAVSAAALYVGLMVRHASQLEAERNAARFEAERAQQVQDFLIDLFRSADPYAPADPERGRTITVVEALDLGTGRVQSELRARPLIRESLLAAISEVYGSLSALDRALPLREQVLEMQRARGAGSTEIAESLGRLAGLRSSSGDVEGAREAYEERLALAMALDPPQPGLLGRAHIDLGVHLSKIRELDDAEAHLKAALALEGHPLDTADRAEAHRILSDVYYNLGRYEPSEAEARTALALRTEAQGPDAVLTGLAHVTLAQVLGDVGRFEEARAHLETSIDVLDRRLGPDHPETLGALNGLSVLHVNRGRFAEAAALQRRLLERWIAALGDRHWIVGDAYQNLGTSLGRLGRVDEAGKMHAQAAAIYRTALASDNYRRALPLLSLSNIRLAQRRFADAEAAAREAARILADTLPAGHYASALAQCRAGRALIGQKRHAEAVAFIDQGVSGLRDSGPLPGFSQEYRRECLEAAADFYQRRGQPDEAAAIQAALGG